MVTGGAATGLSPSPLLTYVVEPLKAPRADFFAGGLCATDLQGHSFRVTDPRWDEAPSWSHDGGAIAFLRAGLSNAQDHLNDVVIADAEGRHLRVLTGPEGRGTFSKAAWSPDGRALGFAFNGLGGSLNILNLDGSPGYFLGVGYPGGFSPPSWSPDGRKVLFSVGGAAPPGGSVPGTYVVSPDGSNLHLVLESAHVPTWSPDGRQFAYLSDTGILGVARADGSNPHLLVRSSGIASWSPDSTRLAYVDPSGNVGVVQADGSGSHMLTQRASPLYSPAWSPDGELIAFTRGLRNSARITLIRPDGTGETALATDGVAAHGPVWGPPGAFRLGSRPCAMRGTARADVIRGTGRGDLILGGRGNDTIYGRGGPDALVGGLGHDRLYGGASDDVFNARDRLRDFVFGGSGEDRAFVDPVDVRSVEKAL